MKRYLGESKYKTVEMETRAPPPKERKPHSLLETRKSKATPAKASKDDEHEARVNQVTTTTGVVSKNVSSQTTVEISLPRHQRKKECAHHACMRTSDGEGSPWSHGCTLYHFWQPARNTGRLGPLHCTHASKSFICNGHGSSYKDLPSKMIHWKTA